MPSSAVEPWWSFVWGPDDRQAVLDMSGGDDLTAAGSIVE